METSSLNSLATYINSLPLTANNRRWLAEEIMKPTLYITEIKSASTKNTAENEGLLSFAGIWEDDPDADVMFDSAQRYTMQGRTRQIESLDE